MVKKTLWTQLVQWLMGGGSGCKIVNKVRKIGRFSENLHKAQHLPNLNYFDSVKMKRSAEINKANDEDSFS